MPLGSNRVVRGLDPDLFAAFADTKIFRRLILAPAETLPEIAVVGAIGVFRLHEHAVMPALDLIEMVVQRIAKILVRRQDLARQRKLDNSLRLRDRCKLAGRIGRGELLRGDVGGKLDDLERLARGIQNGVVGRLDPDFLAALADPLEFGCLEFTTPQLFPEGAIIGTGRIGRLDEHAVMLPGDLSEIVAQGTKEIGIGRNDRSVDRELDHRLRTRYRVDDSLGLVSKITFRSTGKQIVQHGSPEPFPLAICQAPSFTMER